MPPLKNVSTKALSWNMCDLLSKGMAQFLDADVDYGEEPQDAGGAGVGRGGGVVEGLDGRGGDMPAAVIEGFSQVAGPAHAAAAQGNHGGQQGVDNVAGG